MLIPPGGRDIAEEAKIGRYERRSASRLGPDNPLVEEDPRIRR